MTTSSAATTVTEGPARPPSFRIHEVAISRAWHERGIPDELITTDGRNLRVVHRGTWTHGIGPDFREAMIEFDGRAFVTGSVEAHLETSGWRNHRHHADPRYNDVVLHLVLRHDTADARRLDGAIVPTVVVPESMIAPFTLLNVDWSRFGGATCAEERAHESPDSVRAILWRLGDVRLAAKAARLEARLSAIAPAEVLYQEIWDGLGFSTNREPMHRLATILQITSIERTLTTAGANDRLAICRGLLFGVAGFLPMPPTDATSAGLSPAEIAAAETAWHFLGTPWHSEQLSPAAWTRARVRPANHPVLRLATGAALIANAASGITPLLLDSIRSGHDATRALQDLSRSPLEITLGQDRARAIIANALIPFALALSEQTEDAQLSEAASRAWERLPAAGRNEVTKRALKQVAGTARLPGLGARGEQGLIQLDSALCSPRRCRECPIANLVVSSASASDVGG
ncbi:MAG: DUF2851 family protein [Thermomicrobiales bacterium]